MTLEEFAKNLLQDVLARADDSPNYAVDIFTEHVVESITETGEADGCILCNCKRRGFKVNAYNVSEDGDCVDLFVTSYSAEEPPRRVSRSEVERHFGWLEEFFARCFTNSFRGGLEESSAEFDAAHEIYSQRDLITRGRLFFLTDGLVALGNYEDIVVHGVRFTRHVWDLERLYRIETSGAEREKIDIWFERDFGGVVTCIATTDPTAEYSTLLGFFPATLLVGIYEEYGARLLERNVRSFLQARGKINRGIRETILKEPRRFLAYNNGISATAERIDFRVNDGNVLFLTHAEGFQIVNGGQTTASLYSAVKKDKADVREIMVQVKLTIPRQAKDIDELAPKISLYANSQNKVNTADFSANHPFHLRVEELSRTIWAPAASGSQIETKWFYERARGSYMDQIGRLGFADRSRWQAQNPPSQKFVKTDLAKFENSWDQLPYLVSRGAEKNFFEFMATLEERFPLKPDETFFCCLIAKAILFRSSERIVQAQNYGGYRANIVTYSISWLSQKIGKQVDLEKIWRQQKLSTELEEVIRLVSKQAYDHLVGGAAGGNVTEWAKREKCWDQFSRIEIPIPSKILSKLSLSPDPAPRGTAARAARRI